jgi:hypothetical protein
MATRPEVSTQVLDRLRPLCMALPEVYEEPAWIGRRWRIRTKTIAHVAVIDEGKPQAFARAARQDGPLTVLIFRSSGPELVALRNSGAPFFHPVWFPDVVGIIIDDATDWAEISELVTESYCCQAPKTLVRQVIRPGTEG